MTIPVMKMSKPDETRAARRLVLLDAMADHLLAHGLAGSPLRALAAAAGTSDRMLLYYFADKDELLTALLKHVAAHLTVLLSVAGIEGRHSRAALLSLLWQAAREDAVRPYMLLFLELAAAAGRGEEPHRTAAGQISQGFAGWVSQRLESADAQANSWSVMAALDGLFLLHAAGCAAEANAASASIFSEQSER